MMKIVITGKEIFKANSSLAPETKYIIFNNKKNNDKERRMGHVGHLSNVSFTLSFKEYCAIRHLCILTKNTNPNFTLIF